ncbi:MAG: winged helix DNA-binding domain-containing protein [Prevotellaceae bacterium]|jgi:hypothetical protein|nr:winged helix DNA-binding domain-containing protein [Prevotellaceae bacterium]
MGKITDIRIISQRLTGEKLQTPKDIVSWMGAMQAQDFNMVKWAVGMRLTGYTEKMVEEAFNRGDILRTHVMRPTWHLVTPGNIRWMLSLSAEKIKSSAKSRDRDLEITEELYSKSNDVITKSLEGKNHLTREALGEELKKAKILINPARLVHFMMRAELDGVICSGALQGKKHTYALLDEIAPTAKTLYRDEALAQLVKTYFTSHCPATLQDFVWWSGLSKTEAKKGLDAVKSYFVTEKIDNQEYLIANEFASIANSEKSVFLLPAFDEYIISYRDRTAALSSEHQRKAISSQGVFRPTILVNGQVTGLWRKSPTQTVIPDFFDLPNSDTKNRVEKAIDCFKAFLKQ